MKESSVRTVATESRNRGGAPGRLTVLVCTLAVAAALVPISRRYWIAAKPAAPSKSVDAAEAIRYYQQRIGADLGDVDAYIALGTLEEQKGYYSAAVRHLYSARALGSKAAVIAGPLGRSLMHLGRGDEARVELKTALDAAPDSVEAASDLAGLYNENGHPQTADALLRAFVTKHPAFPARAGSIDRDAVVRLIGCFDDLSDSEMTLMLARQLIRITPNEAVGYGFAGTQLAISGDAAAAADNLSKAVQLAPTNELAHFRYGTVLESLGRHAEALHEWQEAARLNPGAAAPNYPLAAEYARRKDWRAAAAAYEEAARNSTGDARACQFAGDMYRRAGDPVAADYWHCVGDALTQNFSTALDLAKRVAADPRPLWRRRGMMSMATSLRGLKRNSAYIRAMQALTASGTADDLMRLAEAYNGVERPDDAVACLHKVIALDPAVAARANFMMAGIHDLQGSLDDAETEAAAAVRAAPTEVDYHRRLATILFKRQELGDRLQRARAEYEQVLRLAPYDEVAWRQAGIADEAAGEWRSAAARLEHAIDLEPGDGHSYLHLGRIYKQLGDANAGDQMLALYRRYQDWDQQHQVLVTQLRQRTPGARVALADFVARSGDYRTAAQHYEIALAETPGDTGTLRKLARMYARLGRKDDQAAVERTIVQRGVSSQPSPAWNDAAAAPARSEAGVK